MEEILLFLLSPQEFLTQPDHDATIRYSMGMVVATEVAAGKRAPYI
jgi:hypothetical protein